MKIILTESQYNLLTEAKELKTTHPLYAKLFNKFRSDLLEDKELSDKAKQITTVDISQKNIDKLELTPNNLMEIRSNDDIILGYIEKYNELAKNNIEIKNFDCGDKKLTFKDFNTLTFKCFEQNVDSKYSQYKSKEEFKGNENIREYKDLKNEFVYSDENLDVYKSTTKANCIQYVELLANKNKKNYSFCISDKKNNLFYSYRYGSYESAIFFVYDKSLPQDNPKHLLVIGVRPQKNGSMLYMTTEGNNDHYTENEDINDSQLIRTYPKLKKLIDNDILIAEPITNEELKIVNTIRSGTLDKIENFKTLTEEQKEIYIDVKDDIIPEDIYTILSPELKHKVIYNYDEDDLNDTNLHYLINLTNSNKEDFYYILNKWDLRNFVFQEKGKNFKLKFPDWADFNKLTNLGKIHSLFLFKELSNNYTIEQIYKIHKSVIKSDDMSSDFIELFFYIFMGKENNINYFIEKFITNDDNIIDFDYLNDYIDELNDYSIAKLLTIETESVTNNINNYTINFIKKRERIFNIFLDLIKSRDIKEKKYIFDKEIMMNFIVNEFYDKEYMLNFAIKHNIQVKMGTNNVLNNNFFYSYLVDYALTEEQRKYVLDKNIENIRFIIRDNEDDYLYIFKKINLSLLKDHKKESYIRFFKIVLDVLPTHLYGKPISSTLLLLTNINSLELANLEWNNNVKTVYDIYELVKSGKLTESKRQKELIITESQFKLFQTYLDSKVKEFYTKK